MQSAGASTRLRCDPTDYARKQQEKKDRAKDLREQRSKGVFSEDHTFAPKTNPKSRAAEPSSREEQERTPPPPSSNPFDDMPIRPAKRPPAVPPHTRSNNNHPDADEADAADALDNLSRRYPKKAPAAKHAGVSSPTPLEPEHDTLFREVKRATGKELDDLPIRSAPAPATSHSGPCLRNSSCGCAQCRGGGGSSTGLSARPEPLARRREMRVTPADDPYACQSNTSRSHHAGSPHEMESSLALLKSKMSRRKSRSAPTNQASLFVEKSGTPAAQSARQAPSVAATSRMQQQQGNSSSAAAPRRVAPAVPSRAAVPPQQAASKIRQPAAREEPQDDGDVRYPPPISSGFHLSEQPDEYPDETEETDECDNCHRRFVLSSFAKHRKICEKVFSAQRKVFNMAAKRLEGIEVEKIAKKASRSGGGSGAGKKGAVLAEEQPLAKKADWKSKSSSFRDAMKASREVTIALKEGRELPPMKASAPDPSLIQCEFCQRRFNDKAAERHIAFCREKSQRDNLKGPPKKPAAPVAKPTRAPVKKK